MSSAQDIGATLLAELIECQGRLSQWVENHASFGRPKVRSTPDPTFKTWRLPYVAQVVGLFVARLNWNLRAVHVLCSDGLAVQAQPVVRAALESSIDLRYISTNPQTLVSKWCIFEDVQRYRHLGQLKPHERPSDFELIERQVSLRLRQLDKHSPHKSGKPWTAKGLAKDWDLSNLAERDKRACAALGEDEPDLYGMYKLLSGNLHGGIESANDFVMSDGHGKFVMVSGIADRKRVFVPWLAMYCLSTSIRSAIRCGASLTEQVGPRWDTLGIEATELRDAAIEDFAYAVLPTGQPVSLSDRPAIEAK